MMSPSFGPLDALRRSILLVRSDFPLGDQQDSVADFLTMAGTFGEGNAFLDFRRPKGDHGKQLLTSCLALIILLTLAFKCG